MVSSESHQGIKQTSFICGQCDLCFETLEECTGHVDSHMFRCFKCPFEAKEKLTVEKHENNHHSTILDITNNSENYQQSEDDTITAIIENTTKTTQAQPPNPSEICPFCKLQSKNLEELKKHIENIHIHKQKHNSTQNEISVKEVWVKCQHCEFTGTEIDIEAHKKMHVSEIICDKCGVSCQHSEALELHLSTKHSTLTESPKCNLCGLVLANANLLKEHVESHSTEPKFNCKYCEFTCKDNQSLETHMIANHEDTVIFRAMAQQVYKLTDGCESLASFKTELSGFLQASFDNQHVLKQELFLLRNCIQTFSAKYSQEPSQSEQHPRRETFSSTPLRKSPGASPQAPPPPASSCPPTYPQSVPSCPEPASSSPPPYPEPSPSCPPSYSKPHHTQQLLYIGDSISANADFDTLEKATENKFIKVKAYTAVYDTETNEAKHPAKFPAANFHDVITNEVKKRNFKHLVVQAGSVDISNLNTKNNPEKHIEYFKSETVKSATNLFNAATNALTLQPSLQKVVIMKHIPRYDPASVDPLALKTALSQLYNNTLTNLWTESLLRDKIYIGNHNIECSGAIRESRYRHTQSGRYDGIHLFGSSGMKAYTLSVLNILQKAEVTSSDYTYHQSCPQAVYQKTSFRSVPKTTQNTRKPRVPHPHFTVPIHNRFASFQYNQGNW